MRLLHSLNKLNYFDVKLKKLENLKILKKLKIKILKIKIYFYDNILNINRTHNSNRENPSSERGFIEKRRVMHY